MNTYSYVGGNPVGFIDPFGLERCYAVGQRRRCFSGQMTAKEFEIQLLYRRMDGPMSPIGVAATAGEAISCLIPEIRGARPLLAPKNGKLPDSVFSSKAPILTSPGTKTIENQYINNKGRVEPWKAYYDDYGRQIGRTDYNAGNKAQGIPNTHQHTKEYNAKFPDGHSTGDHLPGEYRP